ncbi:YjdJ family protein [Bacillus piscicola]|uniref:YjdJ family protein n=1 Tax=Bacillus piscicola TaxID=1632684 RepID=UPI001F0931C4|nr:YjdJ family protein [Bacillus piscicola]
MFLFVIQLGIVSILLLFSTLAAWYEGSAILDNPWEWKYSTPFSQLFHGEVQNSSHVSQLDHFVYAAKFGPTFPIIVVISTIYLIVLLGYYFLKRQLKGFAYYLFFWSGVLMLLSSLISKSPTPGGQILFNMWLLSGLLCAAIAVYLYVRSSNRGKREEGLRQ